MPHGSIRWLSLFVLAALALQSPGDAAARQGGVEVLNANFDQGIGQWIVSPAIDGVVWAADATPATLLPPSAPNSLNYNDGVDFVGPLFQTVQGSADSPPFNLTGATGVTVSFQCRWDTENSNFYDQKWVRLSNTAFATNLFEAQLWTGAVAPANCGPQLTWHPHTFQVFGAAVPNVQLRFFFNSMDAGGNNGAGWAVDNVIVFGQGLTPPAPPPPAGGGGGGAPPDPPKNINYDNRIDELREENCGSGASSSGWMLLGVCVLAVAAGFLRRA